MSNFVGLASANDDVLREIFAWAEYVLPITWKPIRNADGSNRRVDREGVSTECRAYNLGWVRFSQVCRRWRTISLDNSGPWARNVSVIIPAHRTFLYRARERTIVLDMRFVDPRIPVTPELLKRVDTLICNEVGSRYWKPLLHNHHLPRLRIFSVEGPCHLGDSVELDAPNLQSLSLASLRAVYTNSLPTLRTLNLDLKSMPSERWQLLDILSKAPNLEELHVPLLWRPDVQEDVWNPPRHLWDWGFFGGGVVQLGSLRRLNLEVDSSSGVVEFFERIRASDDASVCIHYHDRSDADRITALRNSLTQYDRLGTGNAIRLLSGYTVIPGPRRYSDWAEFALFHHVSDDRSIPPPLDGNNIPLDGIAFRFHYSNMSVLASIFRQLTHDIDADRIAHIDFDASLTFYERESVITMLSAFTEVKSLHIGGFFAAGPLLQLLARPELFPSLQEVLITIHKNWAKGEDRWATWWEEIVAVLDWRANGGVSIDRLVLLGTWRPAEHKNGARMTDEAGLTEARRRVRVLVDRREVL